jgi:hypothetical protein
MRAIRLCIRTHLLDCPHPSHLIRATLLTLAPCLRIRVNPCLLAQARHLTVYRLGLMGECHSHHTEPDGVGLGAHHAPVPPGRQNTHADFADVTTAAAELADALRRRDPRLLTPASLPPDPHPDMPSARLSASASLASSPGGPQPSRPPFHPHSGTFPPTALSYFSPLSPLGSFPATPPPVRERASPPSGPPPRARALQVAQSAWVQTGEWRWRLALGCLAPLQTGALRVGVVCRPLFCPECLAAAPSDPDPALDDPAKPPTHLPSGAGHACTHALLTTPLLSATAWLMLCVDSLSSSPPQLVSHHPTPTPTRPDLHLPSPPWARQWPPPPTTPTPSPFSPGSPHFNFRRNHFDAFPLLDPAPRVASSDFLLHPRAQPQPPTSPDPHRRGKFRAAGLSFGVQPGPGPLPSGASPSPWASQAAAGYAARFVSSAARGWVPGSLPALRVECGCELEVE